MNLSLFYIILLLCLLINIWIGIRTKCATTISGYFLGNKGLGFFKLMCTILATQVGGSTVLGAAEEAYSKGWAVLLFPLGGCLGLLILATSIGKKLRARKLNTIAELFEKAYGSLVLRRIASIMSIISLFLILIGAAIALRKFLFSMGITQPYLFFLFWATLVYYTVKGGYKAVVNTDIFQIIFIAGIFSLTAGILFFSGGETSVVTESPAITNTTLEIPWAAWLLMPMLFMFIEQDMGQRCFSALSSRVFSWAGITAALFWFSLILLPLYLGISARDQGILIPEGASVLISSVQAFTNPAVSAIFASAVLMAILSTADSLLCSIASNLSYDFPWGKGKTVRAKQITLVVGISSFFIAFNFDNIVAITIMAYELSVYLLLVPLLMGIWRSSPCSKAAYVSIVCGALGYFFIPDFGKEIISLSFSTFSYIGTERIMKSKLVVLEA